MLSITVYNNKIQAELTRLTGLAWTRVLFFVNCQHFVAQTLYVRFRCRSPCSSCGRNHARRKSVQQTKKN